MRCEEDPNGGRTSRGELLGPRARKDHSLAHALLDLFMVTGLALFERDETRKGGDTQVLMMDSVIQLPTDYSEVRPPRPAYARPAPFPRLSLRILAFSGPAPSPSGDMSRPTEEETTSNLSTSFIEVRTRASDIE